MYEKQPDLFHNFPKSSKKSLWQSQKTTLQNGKLSSFFISREHLFFICCGFILIVLLAYSLGVAHGKHMQTASKAKEKQFQKTTTEENRNKTLDITTKDVNKLPPVTSTKNSQAAYAIQVATYKQKSRAQKEVALLKTKDIDAFILEKGIYFQVYAGNYSTSSEANKILKKLQNRYEDAFIRKMTSE